MEKTNTHKTKYIVEQVHKLKNKPYEILLIAPLLTDPELLDIRPFTQHSVQSDSGLFFIDLYYSDLKIAIEIDEEYHEKQITEDTERERIITEKEQCTFKRVKIDDKFDFTTTLKILKEFIVSKRDELIKLGSFTKWTIKTFDISQAQKDHPKTVFFKATKPFDSGFDPTRGPIRISEQIRKNADTFATISGDTVTNVYSIKLEDWENYGQGLGYIHKGLELPNHSLLSSGTTEQWIVTSNRILGNDLKE
ncbi:hypothetical protein GCM10011506_06560 [Marivirga lumbricoides]|uniref:Restriction endonuclease PvuRts1 I-like N-terminal domain-containing protein n=1 Tax=Marivirga lumbricoides TaxID=1046115 RepID=A0ABQ1LF91_9BACT|nr:hypothetical protein GCM10011506_06560 [Marivirga lumbricoides]